MNYDDNYEINNSSSDEDVMENDENMMESDENMIESDENMIESDMTESYEAMKNNEGDVKESNEECEYAEDVQEDESISSSLNEAHKKLPDWSELPPLALEQVYIYLDRKDQSQMSLVCKKWSQEYSAPKLWRNVKFVLPERVYPTELYPEVQWAQRFGNMFRHVEIACRSLSENLHGVIGHQLKLFLQTLTFHSQLSSIAFVDLGIYFGSLDQYVFEDIFQNIMNLLLSQNKLISIEFRNSDFIEDEAVEMFRSICVKHSGTLKILKLGGFLSESIHSSFIYEVADARPYYDFLMNLHEMVVDYSHIFENIIIQCFHHACFLDQRGKRGFLEKMKINCYGSDWVSYQGIPPEAWRSLKYLCPALKIDVVFHTEHPTVNEIDLFVVRHMPARSLNFKWSQFSTEYSETEIGSLLKHIVRCDINDFLEELSIMCPHNSTHLARDLIPFLQICPRLKVLQFYILHPAEALDTVFQWWLEKGLLSLQETHITISNVPSMECIRNYANLADEYGPLLQVLGLNLILIADSV